MAKIVCYCQQNEEIYGMPAINIEKNSMFAWIISLGNHPCLFLTFGHFITCVVNVRENDKTGFGGRGIFSPIFVCVWKGFTWGAPPEHSYPTLLPNKNMKIKETSFCFQQYISRWIFLDVSTFYVKVKHIPIYTINGLYGKKVKN